MLKFATKSINMKYDYLSGTSIKVSKICLGTMTFGQQNTEAEAHSQLDFAFEKGVNFIDTAELYAVPSTKENNGKTEDFIGSWLSKSGKRDQLIIGTKVTGVSNNLKFISENLGFSKDRVNEAVNRSLKRLKTDYVDLYQLHWPERKANFFGQLGYEHDKNDPWTDNISEVVATMDHLVKAGKIRHWGLSNETPWGTMRFLQEADKAGVQRPVSIQNPYSLVNRSYEVGMSEISMRENIGCLAYSPLAMGILSGKYYHKTDQPHNRLNQFKAYNRYRSDIANRAIGKYYEISQSNGLSITQMALAFVNSRSFMTSTIIGATSLTQLEENINSIDIVLSDEIINQIENIHKEYSNPAL